MKYFQNFHLLKIQSFKLSIITPPPPPRDLLSMVFNQEQARSHSKQEISNLMMIMNVEAPDVIWEAS